MVFKDADYDWSDWHKGLTLERQKRYQEVIDAIFVGLETILKENHEGHDINAQVPEGVFAVGVQGDKRTYCPVVFLTYGEFPGYDHISRISTAISNTLPVNRVTLNLTHKVVSLPEQNIQVIVQR
jgi:hypothetical protein